MTMNYDRNVSDLRKQVEKLKQQVAELQIQGRVQRRLGNLRRIVTSKGFYPYRNNNHETMDTVQWIEGVIREDHQEYAGQMWLRLDKGVGVAEGQVFLSVHHTRFEAADNYWNVEEHDLWGLSGIINLDTLDQCFATPVTYRFDEISGKDGGLIIDGAPC